MKILMPTRFDEKEVPLIQKFADEKCEGNFSMAVRVLTKKALNRVNEFKIKEK